MNGLEKILEQINQEAEITATKIVNEAKIDVREIEKKAKQDAKAETDKIEQKTESICKDIAQRGKSAAGLHKRQAMLLAKQNAINEILDKAYHALINLPDDEYFVFILKLVKKHSLKEEGTIYFNEKDLQRLPIIFGAQLEQTANGKLNIAKEAKDIDGGFVLSYGGIEENCSIKAIFNSKEEQLQDEVNSMLFA